MPWRSLYVASPGFSHAYSLVVHLVVYTALNSLRFRVVILEIGFQRSIHSYDPFVRRTTHGLVLLLFYVDDMIITGFDSHAWGETPYLPRVWEERFGLSLV